MIFHKKKRKGEGLIGGIGTMAGTLLIALALLPLTATTSTGSGTSDWATDEEAGGSLPSTGWIHEDLGFGRTVLDNRPSFYLQGPPGVIADAVAGTEGDHYFERLYNREGELEQLRAVFRGEVHLSLDASIFHQPGVTAGLKVGWTFGDAYAAIVFQDRIVEKTTMPAESVFPVPFAAMQDAGILGDGLYFFGANVRGQRHLISVGTFPGVVEIHQREVQS